MPIVSATPELNTTAPNFSQRSVDITDKRALAAQLLALKQQDPNQMVSGRVVAYNPLTAAFDGLSKGFGAYLDTKASEDEKALKQSKADTLRSLINSGQTGADSMAASGLIDPEAYAAILAKLHENQAQPYHTLYSTDKGTLDYDHRSGKLIEALLNGEKVMKASDSPSLQGAIASAKEGPQTAEVTLSDGSKVPLTNEQANQQYNYRTNTPQPNPQALASALMGNKPPAQSVYDFADPQTAMKDFTRAGDMQNAQGVANQYGLNIGQSTAAKVGTEEAIKRQNNVLEAQQKVPIEQMSAQNKADIDINKAQTENNLTQVRDSDNALSLIDKAWPLLDNSTHSGVGHAVDAVQSYFGGSNKGADNAAALRVIAGGLVAKMPKMSGPQSDYDVKLYKEMAGQVSDDTIPISQRKAALNVLKTIQDRYANQSPQLVGNGARAPKIGDTEDGHTFLGGNPADPKNWRQ